MGKGGGASGARGGGGGGGNTVRTASGAAYSQGETVGFKESDTRYKLENGETVSKTIGKVVDHTETERNISGDLVRTNIVQGSKGNLYSVETTYKEGISGLYASKTTIRKATRKG